jgi:hypothetical protein
VELTAGDAAGGADGGSAEVLVYGNLDIEAASEKTGDASLNLLAGAGAGSGSDGETKVDVGKTLSLTSGAGAANHGEAFYKSDRLKAQGINLTKKAGNLTFEVDELLEVTDRDTTITLKGTDAASAMVNQAEIGLGRALSVFASEAKTDSMAIKTIRVAPGDFGRLGMPANNIIEVNELDVHEASFAFILPDDIEDGDTFMKVAKKSDVTDSDISLEGDLDRLDDGDVITLIDGSLTGGETVEGPYEQSLGFTRLFIFDLEAPSSGDLLLNVRAKKINPRAKSLSEGRLGASAFINQAGDLLADAGIASARRVTASQAGPALFTAISFSDIRYETGSHVDVKGLSVLLGAAYGFEFSSGKVTIGGFLEYGTGSYDTYNDFPLYQSVRGSGDTSYFGGGLLGRLEISHASGSTYAELSARAGRISADFETLDFILYPVSYDASSTYYGLHAGLGHVFNLSDNTDLDLYAKYFWTRQLGQSVEVPDPVTFDTADSHRLRAGARLTRKFTDSVGLYVGAAYERGFGGAFKASSRGLAIDAPELRGNTGMGELGLSVSASENLSLDFGLQGYAGARKGFTGSVRVNFTF